MGKGNKTKTGQDGNKKDMRRIKKHKASGGMWCLTVITDGKQNTTFHTTLKEAEAA